MKKINWEKSVWFFDVDDTLIDTAITSLDASGGIRDIFAKHYDIETGIKIQQEFNVMFQSMMEGYRIKSEFEWKNAKVKKEYFKQILSDIESRQLSVKEKYGAIKKWSREVLIKIASDKLGLKTTPKIIKEAANAYWDMLTEMTFIFSDALELINKIKENKRPIFLITSSDARLEMKEDGQFVYDPSHSEKLKMERMELLKERGIDYDLVSIGDPEDKPHLDFFEKGINLAEKYLGQKIEAKNSIMVGDSFAGDLETPLRKLNFGLAILRNANNTDIVFEEDKYVSVNNFKDIIKL